MALSDICVLEYGGCTAGSLMRCGRSDRGSAPILARPATASSCRGVERHGIVEGVMWRNEEEQKGERSRSYFHDRVYVLALGRVIGQSQSFEKLCFAVALCQYGDFWWHVTRPDAFL